MVRVHLRIEVPRRERSSLDRRPRPPRVACDVDLELVAPVAVDGGGRHPLPADEAGLHGELGPVARQERLRARRIRIPSFGAPVLRCAEQLTSWDAGQEHERRRVWAVEPSALTRHVLLEGVAEQVGVRRVARDGVAVDGGGAAVRGATEIEASECHGVVAGDVRRDGMPPETVRRLGVERVLAHLGPEDQESTSVDLASHRPEPGRQRGRPGSRLEGCRSLGRATVEQPEAGTLLHHRGVVDEVRPVERGRRAGLIEEGVLEQPQPTTSSEVVHVLVVPSEHGPDPLREVGVECLGRRVRRTTDVGGHVPTGGDVSGCRPWRRGCSGRRRRRFDRNGTSHDGGIVTVLWWGRGDGVGVVSVGDRSDRVRRHRGVVGGAIVSTPLGDRRGRRTRRSAWGGGGRGGRFDELDGTVDRDGGPLRGRADQAERRAADDECRRRGEPQCGDQSSARRQRGGTGVVGAVDILDDLGIAVVHDAVVRNVVVFELRRCGGCDGLGVRRRQPRRGRVLRRVDVRRVDRDGIVPHRIGGRFGGRTIEPMSVRRRRRLPTRLIVSVTHPVSLETPSREVRPPGDP